MKDWTLKPAIVLALLASALVGSGAAASASAAPGRARVSYAPVGGPASAPYGWPRFLPPLPRRVRRRPVRSRSMPSAGSKMMKEIERVNKWVNAHIQPVTDMEHWGVVDQWDYPSDGKGDCEDFALLKRKILLEEGFPRQALLMTVVKDADHEGHAILTVKTTRRRFRSRQPLVGEMRLWDRTNYRFVKRQSQIDQNVWVQLGDPTPDATYVSR